MAEEKKTQIGPPGRTHRPTAGQDPVAPAVTPAPLSTPAPIATPAPGGSTSYLPPSDDPLIGSTLMDRYVISKKLGEGGMGAVYLATHTLLEKQVALKVLHGEFARKTDLVERFMQEAKSASRIRHENVIDISDFGVTPDGLVFFAMELLKGHDLHEDIARARLDGHLLPWSRSKKIFLQICAALAAAHAKGIIHRDLKPENVYLVDFLGDPDFVKLLDFGIAKLTEAAEDGGRKLTKTGMLFGTPEYMSPEQARGEQVDVRVDVYAMGCILFQLVTSRVPFEADNFMGVLTAHLTEPPPVIAPEVFDQIGAPRELAQVIDRALEKDRNARWSTIEELANAVRRVSGDPMPSEKGRAASVPAPATPTSRRTPADGMVSGPTTTEGTGRIKTQWTGTLHVPEEDATAPRARSSKVPLIIGALVIAGGAAVAAMVATRGHGSAGTDVGSGSAGSAVIAGSANAGSAGSAAVVVTPPPQPPVEPKIPDMVSLVIATDPAGATVTDVTTNKPLPNKTPFTLHIPGAKATRQYVLHLHGYADALIELPLSHDTLDYVEKLQKGKSIGKLVVHTIGDPGIKPVPDAGSAAVVGKPPDLGSAVVVKPPDTGSATVVVKPPDTGSAAVVVKPPDTGSAKPIDDCDEMPPPPHCLKAFGSARAP